MVIYVKKYNKDIGNYGEIIAKNFLIKHHYKIICCNYRCPFGEIDIICLKDNIISFVEVKSRGYLKFGSPFDAITNSKKNRIRNVCRWYIAKNMIKNYNFRFDVISIIFLDDNTYHIKFLENAF